MALAHDHLRRDCVTGSEIGALFDAHPYLTKYLLWHRKRGTAPEDGPDSEPALRGKFLEDGVARWAAHRLGATILPTSVFLQRQDMPNLGCTPDRYLMIADEVVPLECKTMNFWAARKYEDREVPPPHYALQTELAALLKGAPLGYLAIYFTGDDDLRIYEIPARPERKADLVNAATAFMESVRSGDEPAVTGDDIDTLKAQGAAQKGDAILDLSGDNYLADRCGQYVENARKIKELEAFQDGLKADILHASLGKPCRKAIVGEYEVAFTHRSGSPDKIITQDMVGEVIKGRAGSTSITIKKGK